MRLSHRPVLVLLLALAPACSTPRSARSAAARGSADAITTSDIRATSATNVYDLIQQLRYRWLQRRGTDSINMRTGDVMVRMDDNELGTVQTLRNIPTIGISSIYFVDGVSAAGRWGLGYAHGAVVISTRPPAPEQ
jgi:hypothetical protein